MANKIFTFLAGLFLLSACSGDKCIDADDFGFAKFTISSRYNKDVLTEQKQGNQIAPWLDSGYRVTGRPLLILVKTWEYGTDKNTAAELSAWGPWYGQSNNSATLSKFCEKLQMCKFNSSIMCASTPDALIYNAPCIFKNGVGLYALIAKPGSDPNESFVTQRSPTGITMHIGEPVVGFTLYDIAKNGSSRVAGGVDYNYNDDSALKQEYADSKLYFKILDKYYDDNNGQYKVVIKSGIEDSSSDPIQFLTNLVKTNLFGANGDYGLIRNIYSGIISNAGYRNSVSAILSLYIMFTAFSFLTGNLNITHTELITRVIKIGIVSALLSSEYSWTFFNDYLFVYFVGGVEQILQMIRDAAQTGSGSSSILGLMIAPQTLSKLLALLFVDGLGFIYIILFMIALYFVFMTIFEATVIYLTALIAIGMIITMGPIFICFMLFQITRSLFENWLRQLISYAMQPIILFTGIALISIIIRTEIYTSLGYKVCKHDFPYLGPIGDLFGEITDSTSEALGLDVSMGNSIFYWWFPVPSTGENFTKTKAIIPVPMDYFKSDGTFCPAYGCFENRYIELPYLDPLNNNDNIKANSFFNGKFVQLDSLLLIFVAVYLLMKFNELSVSVSKFLSSSSGNLTDLQASGQQAFAPIKQQLDRPIDAVKGKVDQLRESVSLTAAKRYEDVMTQSLAKGSTKENANPAVLAEVKRKYGMDSKDLKEGAHDEYKEAIKDRLREINPNTDEKSLESEAKKLSYKNHKELGEEFQGLKLSSDAKFARDFQEAYVDAHQEMSARGIGTFGKNIWQLRTLQEINNSIDSSKELKREQRTDRLANMYGKLERSILGDHIDKNDYRYRTGAELDDDRKRGFESQKLNAQINKETLKINDDIMKPEYLVKLQLSGDTKNLALYEALSRRKISDDVYKALSENNDPALMGQKFTKERATNSQSKHMIDRAYEIEKKLIENDRYIKRQDQYDSIHKKAIDNIKEKYDLLKDHYKRDDIKPEELPILLEKYYDQSPAIDLNTSKEEVKELEKSLKEFDYTKIVLEKIEERKELIRQEVRGHVENINKARGEANLPAHKKGLVSEARKLRSIEDYLRKPT